MKKLNTSKKTSSGSLFVDSLTGADYFKFWMEANNITEEELQRQMKANPILKKKVEAFIKKLGS